MITPILHHVHYIIVYFPPLGNVEPPSSILFFSLSLCLSLSPFLITDSAFALSQRISTRYRDIKVAFPSDICASRNAGNSSRDSLFLLRVFLPGSRGSTGARRTHARGNSSETRNSPNIPGHRGHVFFFFFWFCVPVNVLQNTLA